MIVDFFNEIQIWGTFFFVQAKAKHFVFLSEFTVLFGAGIGATALAFLPTLLTLDHFQLFRE